MHGPVLVKDLADDLTATDIWRLPLKLRSLKSSEVVQGHNEFLEPSEENLFRDLDKADNLGKDDKQSLCREGFIPFEVLDHYRFLDGHCLWVYFNYALLVGRGTKLRDLRA